jgi:hypothetical protein
MLGGQQDTRIVKRIHVLGQVLFVDPGRSGDRGTHNGRTRISGGRGAGSLKSKSPARFAVAILILGLVLGAGCSGFSGVFTPTPEATGTATFTPTRTATRTHSPSRTPTTDPGYTAMLEVMDKLYEAGYIDTKEGSYHRLEDLRDSEALNLYIFFIPVKDSPTDFVLSGDLRWDFSTNTANTFATGCGFIYRYEDEWNFYGAYLDVDGYAQVFRWVGRPSYLNNGYFGKVTPHNGTARMTIVMIGKQMKIIIDDKLVLQVRDERLEYGSLGYLLASGTNKEPGTTCIWTNVAYWELPQ